MKKFIGSYLIFIGVVETVLALGQADVSPALRPYGGVLWRSFFVESKSASLAFSMTAALIILAVGVSLWWRYNRPVLLAFVIVFGLLALSDLFLPIAGLLSGGSFDLPFGGAMVMLLVICLTEVAPVVLTAFALGRDAAV